MDAKAIQERVNLLKAIAEDLQRSLRQKNGNKGGTDDEIVLRDQFFSPIVHSYKDAIADYKKDRRYASDGRIKADKIAAITSYFILRYQPFHSKRTYNGLKGYATTPLAALANEALAVHVAQAFLGIKRFNSDNLYRTLVDSMRRAKVEIHAGNSQAAIVVQRLFETWGVIAMDELGARLGDTTSTYKISADE